MARRSDTGSRLKHIALGSELAGEVLAPVLLGLWADHAWGTSPIGVLIGTLVGLGAVTATLVRVVKEKSD